MKNYQNEAWLKGKYLDEKLSTPEIAKLCSLNTHVTIVNWLSKFKIRCRTLSEAHLGKSSGMLGKHHSEKTRRIMSRANRGRRLGPFSDEHRRNISKAMKGKLVGNKNPRWNNGATFAVYPPEYNEELREKIRKRDNYTCQNPKCGKVQRKRKFPVHHDDWNPKNNAESNLTTRCLACHLDIHAKDRHREQR